MMRLFPRVDGKPAQPARKGLVRLGAALWAAAVAWALTGIGRAANAPDAFFDFEMLRHRAKLLAAQPYVPPANRVPEWLRKLDYDQYRKIEFEADRSWWRREGLPFQVQFFHPGFLHQDLVTIHELRGKKAEPFTFRRDLFNYHDLKVGPLPATLGYAGFRLMYPLNQANDELGAFLGASYFRFLCQRASYGLSARGLALNTGERGGEEFPRFTEFWIERPTPSAKSITVYALLESESVTGGYRFEITPGPATVMQVKAAVYARREPGVLGIAPLTSMYWRGENSGPAATDFRPEVHDSDGLLMQTGGGEWLWRPLVNPDRSRITMFTDENPRGFGLLQRDRNFDNYQDMEARYHLRPSAWVEPVGRWGRGAVRLVELPTGGEFNDNVVAFWTPEKLPAVGEAIEIEYRLHWFLDQIHPPAGYATATRHGHGLPNGKDLEWFIVDFDGAYLSKHGPDPAIEPVLTVGEGAKLEQSSLQKNPYNGSWRVAFALKPDGSRRPVELRCFLRKPPHVLTETWSYLWQP